MVRSGVRVVVSRVVRVELRMACKAGVIMLPRMTSWEKNSFVQLVDVTFSPPLRLKMYLVCSHMRQYSSVECRHQRRWLGQLRCRSRGADVKADAARSTCHCRVASPKKAFAAMVECPVAVSPSRTLKLTSTSTATAKTIWTSRSPVETLQVKTHSFFTPGSRKPPPPIQRNAAQPALTVSTSGARKRTGTCTVVSDFARRTSPKPLRHRARSAPSRKPSKASKMATPRHRR